jgi:hypothetical protein
MLILTLLRSTPVCKACTRMPAQVVCMLLLLLCPWYVGITHVAQCKVRDAQVAVCYGPQAAAGAWLQCGR